MTRGPIRPRQLVLDTSNERVGRAVARFATAHDLSDREAEILHHAACGCVNKEIAGNLGLSYTTVAAYWSRILRKTGARDQLQVLAQLIRFMTEIAPRTGVS